MDIVERLENARNRTAVYSPEYYALKEAAAEIERLRAENETLRATLKEMLPYSVFLGMAPRHERMLQAALSGEQHKETDT